MVSLPPVEHKRHGNRYHILNIRGCGNGACCFKTPPWQLLLHQVMVSREWKQACPPRVREDITIPYVETWEENDSIIYSPQQNNPGRQHEEPDTKELPEEARHECSTIEPYAGDSSAAPLVVATPEQSDDDSASLGRGRQWDVHWSYTKWAVETMRFAKKLAPWQKVNHFRNSNELCRKVCYAAVQPIPLCHHYDDIHDAHATSLFLVARGRHRWVPLCCEPPRVHV